MLDEIIHVFYLRKDKKKAYILNRRQVIDVIDNLDSILQSIFIDSPF
jgi:hypothetical protein